jgi:hypothetical protein
MDEILRKEYPHSNFPPIETEIEPKIEPQKKEDDATPK